MKSTKIMDRITKANEEGNKALGTAYTEMGENQLKLKSTLGHLAREARIVSERCAKLAEQAEAIDIETDNATPMPPWNSLGVLQGSGSEIDRLCGESVRLAETLAAMHRVIDGIEDRK